jgi:2',3'-cyclic-nucleotide 2'-phosphodiesterase / 3'-nucleotidase
MNQKFWVCLLFFLFWVPVMAQEVTIRIAATSDVHGCLFPYDFEENRAGKSSLSGVSYLVDSIRKIRASNLVLLDNGDLVQGTPVAYYANFVQGGQKNLFARVLNSMKYDAATIGNHDIEAGPSIYNHLAGEFRFPYLGANVINTQTGNSYFQPYTIVERAGIRVAVIGLTTTGVPRWLPGHLWAGLNFQDITEAARYWVNIVREKEHPDAVVGLFHSGYGDDRAIEPGLPLEDAGRYIAHNVPGFDVIILGHDHRPRNEHLLTDTGEDVLVLNPGSAAQNLAFAEIIFNVGTDKKAVLTSKTGLLIKVPITTGGMKFTRQFRKDMAEILSFANQPVGRIENPMRAADALFGNSSLTDLVHKVQMETTGAVISFTAPLTISGVINAGQLYIRDLFKIYRYENFLYTMEMTGNEIQQYLEYSYGLWFNQMKRADDHLLLFRKSESARPSLQNPPYNFDSAAGILYSVDVTQQAGKRITMNGMEDGTPFDTSKTYKVAVNSYRGSGGGGHLTTGAGINPEKLPGRIISASVTDFRTLLMKYIQSRKVISPQPGKNWQVIPVDFFIKGKERDSRFFMNEDH